LNGGINDILLTSIWQGRRMQFTMCCFSSWLFVEFFCRKHSESSDICNCIWWHHTVYVIRMYYCRLDIRLSPKSDGAFVVAISNLLATFYVAPYDRLINKTLYFMEKACDTWKIGHMTTSVSTIQSYPCETCIHIL